MRLVDISKLLEMAGPAQTCGTCGASPIHSTHTYKKDPQGKAMWQCRAANVAAFKAAGGNPQPAADGKYYFTPAGTSQKSTTPPTPAAVPPPTPAAVPPPTPAAVPTPPVSQRSAEPARPVASSMVDQIKKWLKDKGVEGATVNSNNVVDVDDNVTLPSMRPTTGKLPVKFGTVTGNFMVAGGSISSFENFPDRVEDMVYVSAIPVTSLEHLTPSIGTGLSLSSLNNLKSLETSTPIEVGGDLLIDSTSLTSLKNIHKYITRVNGKITIEQPIKDSLLGLLRIKGVTQVSLHRDNRGAGDIINQQLESGERDIHMAQDQMIDANMEDLAKL